MRRKSIFKIAVCVLFIAVAVVWLLSAIMPEKFANLNLSWVIAAFAAALGLVFVIKGLTAKSVGAVKKINIIVGAVFIIAGALALVGTIIKDNLILPIIAVVITTAALLCVLAVGGRKWDTADNEKVGYKNYYERKKEEEKQE